MIVERAAAAPLSENEYYIEDLKKLDVVNQFGKKFGKVVDVINRDSLCEESFTGQLLEYPQWTRPECFEGLSVPPVLLSGHHENIRKWRLGERIKKRFKTDLICLKTGALDILTPPP